MNDSTCLKAIEHNRRIIGHLLSLDDHTPAQEMELISAVAALQALEAQPIGYIDPDNMREYRGKRTGGTYSVEPVRDEYDRTMPIYLTPPAGPMDFLNKNAPDTGARNPAEPDNNRYSGPAPCPQHLMPLGRYIYHYCASIHGTNNTWSGIVQSSRRIVSHEDSDWMRELISTHIEKVDAITSLSYLGREFEGESNPDSVGILNRHLLFTGAISPEEVERFKNNYTGTSGAK